MALHRSPEDPELSVQKNTDIQYFQSIYLVNKEFVSLFPEENTLKRFILFYFIFQINRHVSRLGQQNRTIGRKKVFSPTRKI